MFKYNSKINVANPKSNSLRAGIPKEIVKLLEVEAGDTMEWIVEAISKDEFIIKVAKKEE